MNIFVVGNSNSGKSFTLRALSDRFRGDGYYVSTVRDWDIIKAAAKQDTKQGELVDGWRVGLHTKIRYNEFDEIQIHALDGYLWNQAHWQMIAMAGEQLSPNQIRLMEYATGPVSYFGDSEPLLQTAHTFVERMREVETPHYLVLALKAPYDVRAERNRNRAWEALADETFSAYFQDGGDFSLIEKFLLGGRFLQLDNNSQDAAGFVHELNGHYERWIMPRVNLEREELGDGSPWYRKR